MTIRHLSIFLEVVRCNSMSAAAKKLYISQPTVSQVIAEIESEYQLHLFDRLSRRLYITKAGTRLREYAERIILLYKEMDAVMKSSYIQRIRLGATLTVGTCIFSELITMFHQLHPHIETRVVVENTMDVEKHLLQGELDIALVEGIISNPGIRYEPVIDDSLVLVSNANHPFAGKTSVKLQDLHRQPLILREKGSGTRESFERVMVDRALEVNCVWTCQNTDTIKSAVIAGHGLTVISRRLVQPELSSGVLAACHLEDFPHKRTFALVYHKDKFLLPHFLDFMNLCRKFGQNASFGSTTEG